MDLPKRANDYAKKILAHSLQSPAVALHQGQHYTYLAQLLQSEDDPTSSGQHILAVLYELGASLQERKPDNSWEPDQLDTFQTYKEPKIAQGQLLFLRGHLPPSWIKTVGAKFLLDPEFFRSHLNFPSIQVYQRLFASPSLPSYGKQIITLYTHTVLSRDPSTSDAGRRILKHRQEQMENGKYFQLYRSAARAGDSMVREFTPLSERLGVLTQMISICVKKWGKGWIAVVWMDNGRDLTSGPPGPWLQPSDQLHLETVCFPVPQHVRGIVLQKLQKQTQTSEDPGIVISNGGILHIEEKGSQNSPVALPQSAALLPLQYGQFLDKDTAGNDALYALSEIFRFAAYSEVQFLNVIQREYDRITKFTARDSHPLASLQTLLDYKRLLEQRLEQTRQLLRKRSSLNWPHVEGDAEAKRAAEVAESLEEDYEHLLLRARHLSVVVQEGTTVLMNTASILESKLAMEQTKRMKKLTRPATFFIPLCFIYSVFGMNFNEFGQGDLPLWVWAVTSFPIISLTMLFFFCAVSGFVRRFTRKMP